MKAVEMLQLTDARGNPLGSAPRERCHGDPRLIHATVHLHVFTPEGGLYLQRRSATKDLYPGRWDTAVGGHVAAGENIRQALLREAQEELDLDASPARLMHRYLHANDHESEFVHTFGMRHSGDLRPNPTEVDEVRAFTPRELQDLVGGGGLTPNFEEELARITDNPLFRPG